MANTIVQLHSLPSLGELTLRLYPRVGGEIVNGDGGDAMAESGDTPGLYAATVTEALSGIYAARVYSGSDLIGSYLVNLRDDALAYDLADPVIAVGVHTPALDEINEYLSDEHGDGSWEGSGGGGGSTTYVVHVMASVVSAGEVTEGQLIAYESAERVFDIPIVDQDGEPLTLPPASQLIFVVERDKPREDLFVLEDSDGISVDENVASVTCSAANNAASGSYRFSLRTESSGFLWAHGSYEIRRAALKDA